VKPIIDFDSIRDWEAGLRTALSRRVTDKTIRKIANSNLEFVEDSRDLLFEQAGREDVIDATLAWIRS
jgi:hypothetical protein